MHPDAGETFWKSGPDRLLSIILAVFPFLPIAANVITYRYLHLDYAITARIQLSAILIFLALTLLGWRLGFPDWSYPYIGIVVCVFAALLISSDRDMNTLETLFWKLLVLGPIVLLYTIFWLVFHKRYPLRILLENLRADATLPAFCLYSLLGITIQGVFTDIRSDYGAPFLIISSLFAMSGAALYISLADKSRRLISLAVCFTLAWGVMVFGAASFWDGRQESWMAAPKEGFQVAAGFLLAWGILLALMLLPWIISRLRQNRLAA